MEPPGSKLNVEELESIRVSSQDTIDRAPDPPVVAYVDKNGAGSAGTAPGPILGALAQSQQSGPVASKYAFSNQKNQFYEVMMFVWKTTLSVVAVVAVLAYVVIQVFLPLLLLLFVKTNSFEMKTWFAKMFMSSIEQAHESEF